GRPLTWAGVPTCAVRTRLRSLKAATAALAASPLNRRLPWAAAWAAAWAGGGDCPARDRSRGPDWHCTRATGIGNYPGRPKSGRGTSVCRRDAVPCELTLLPCAV